MLLIASASHDSTTATCLIHFFVHRCVRGMLHEEREHDLDKESSSQSLTQSESLAEIKMTVEEFEQFHTSYAFSTDNLAALDG